MLGLPKETEVNRMVAKKKFYDRAEMTLALKDSFTSEIEKITWANKLAPTTLNIDAGSYIKELEVFHIELRQRNFNQKILETIDNAIPYYILFVLEHKGKQQIWLGYKEKSASTGKASIVKYFHNEWKENQELPFVGNKLDTIYENFLSALSEDLNIKSETETLEQRIERTQEIDALQKEIDALTLKMNREKQFNRQCEIHKQITTLEKKMKGLKNG